MLNQSRIVIENIKPQINCGDVFIKRVIDETVNVTSDVLVDGHDILQASVLYKHKSEKTWKETRMHHVNNDEWQAKFQVQKQGFYAYKIQGWVDYLLNWQYGIGRKIDDHQHVKSELLEGAELLKPLVKKVSASEKKYLNHLIKIFKNADDYDESILEARSEKLAEIL